MSIQPVHIDHPCQHAGAATVKRVPRPAEECEDCVRMGGTWVHLRECLTCGHVACCDSSPNQHATKHFRASGHPICTSVEAGESWVWCYVDEAMISS